jgi:trehalose 6-phosphate synthase
MIVVSHRGPYRFDEADDGSFFARRGAGGIVSALAPLLTDTDDACWIAAAISDADRAAAAAGAASGLGIDLELLTLDQDEHRLHYDVVANSVLWFLHHGMFDRVHTPRFDLAFRDAWDAFVSVNHQFADAIAARAKPNEIVLVQDYQLCLVPGMVRELRADLRVNHFTHTPFSDPGEIAILPEDVALAICRSLASVPAGFHTARWSASYRASARAVLGERANVVPPFVASLGPDVADLETVARSAEARAAAGALADLVGERQVILRSERIEPSKNIVRGFLAFDRLLEARPGLRGRVVFVAMVYASRQTLPEYVACADEVADVVDRVNERWATRHWTPVVLDDRDDFARSVAGFERYDVLLVNALRDGLNLVAKEGPALNRRDGVLCLSPEVGAWAELREAAIPVHPYDIEQAAGALDLALAMPFDERATRASHLRALATARSPRDWLADLVRHTGEERH